MADVSDEYAKDCLLESTSVHPSSLARAAMRLEPLRARRYPETRCLTGKSFKCNVARQHKVPKIGVVHSEQSAGSSQQAAVSCQSAVSSRCSQPTTWLPKYQNNIRLAIWIILWLSPSLGLGIGQVMKILFELFRCSTIIKQSILLCIARMYQLSFV